MPLCRGALPPPLPVLHKLREEQNLASSVTGFCAGDTHCVRENGECMVYYRSRQSENPHAVQRKSRLPVDAATIGLFTVGIHHYHRHRCRRRRAPHKKKDRTTGQNSRESWKKQGGSTRVSRALPLLSPLGDTRARHAPSDAARIEKERSDLFPTTCVGQ